MQGGRSDLSWYIDYFPQYLHVHVGYNVSHAPYQRPTQVHIHVFLPDTINIYVIQWYHIELGIVHINSIVLT